MRVHDHEPHTRIRLTRGQRGAFYPGDCRTRHVALGALARGVARAARKIRGALTACLLCAPGPAERPDLGARDCAPTELNDRGFLLMRTELCVCRALSTLNINTEPLIQN